MAERMPVSLARSIPIPMEPIELPGVALCVEPWLGIASLQISGPHPDARFDEISGLTRPEPCGSGASGPVSVAWLAPGEWLITGAEADVADWRDRIAEPDADDILAIDLTHAQTSFLLFGDAGRTALAAHCPLDLAAGAFPVGAVARSLFGAAGMFIARLADAEDGTRFRLIVDQTMAAYVRRLFAGAGSEPGDHGGQ